MRLRKRVSQLIILSIVIGWFFSGWFLTLVLVLKKDDIVFSLEQDGNDVSECKKRKLSLKYPTAGMPDCLVSSFKDIDRKFERALQEAEGFGEEFEDESRD